MLDRLSGSRRFDGRSLIFGFTIVALGAVSYGVSRGVVVPLVIGAVGLTIAIAGVEGIDLPTSANPSVLIGVLGILLGGFVYATSPSLRVAAIVLATLGVTLVLLGLSSGTTSRQVAVMVVGIVTVAFGAFGIASETYPRSLSAVVAVLGVVLVIVALRYVD
ncbi:hypothetical protein [Halomicrobium salinisoli]|uniref:hypothetical protein n=1 Tax=Halomicrobium salinisoli TaxID=2878391 RepID=UPI001CF0A152|nr:hypothetical protein [Halomicrobium salinisoli]